MRSRAKVEKDIAALGAEVQALSRQRGRALPTPEDTVEVMFALGPTMEAMSAAREPGEDQGEKLAALFAVREVAPGCEALKQAYGNAFRLGLEQDRSGYEGALRELRPLLRAVLVQRADRWSEAWREASRQFGLYLGAKNWLAGLPAPPANAPAVTRAGDDWATEVITKAKGWHLVVLAARALYLAQAELKAWQEWIGGEAARQHALLLSERSSPTPSVSEDPAVRWEREVAKHTVPDEEEAELVQRGVVSAEALAAVKALPPIPPAQEQAA